MLLPLLDPYSFLFELNLLLLSGLVILFLFTSLKEYFDFIILLFLSFISVNICFSFLLIKSLEYSLLYELIKLLEIKF